MKDRETDGMTDDALDRTLASLPYPAPSPDFADRVMARVEIPHPVTIRRPAHPFRRPSLAVAASLAIMIAGAMAGSVIWTLGHQAMMMSLGRQLVETAGAETWRGVQALAALIVRWTGVTPARGPTVHPTYVAIGSAIGSLVYLTGVLVLRRLMILPTSRVMYAQN